jgi:VanZ family protein
MIVFINDEDGRMSRPIVQPRWVAAVNGLLKCAGWLAVISLAIASLVPGPYRPHAGLDGGLEHALAYAVASAILAFTYSSQWRRALIGLGLFAGMLEVLQVFAHGRHPQFRDFVASCLGVIAGGLIAKMAVRFLRAPRPHTEQPELQPHLSPSDRAGTASQACNLD